MRSNYKRLGDYIRVVDVRNDDLEISNLVGLSINKTFIPSVANTIGTEMANYKIIEKGQFACSLMQVRRDKKIPVSLFANTDKAIISPAYIVFEINVPDVLLPEYLMMWMSRSEFDRHACFLAVGGVRGSLEWDDFCDMTLPVPHPDKQREIVREYNTIIERIKLNEQLIQKLEETAQALYKQWFVDFEFPISKEYAESIGKPEFEGKPYKANDQSFRFDETLEKEIPTAWKFKNIEGYCKEMMSGGTPKRDVIEFWNSNDVPWLKTGEIANCVIVDSEEYISEEGLKKSSAKLLPVNSVLMAMYGDGKTKGQVGFLKFQAATNQACSAMVCESEISAAFLYFYLLFSYKEIVNQANGGAQENLSKNLIEQLPILEPDKNTLQLTPFVSIIGILEHKTRQNIALNKFKDLLLRKITKMD